MSGASGRICFNVSDEDYSVSCRSTVDTNPSTLLHCQKNGDMQFPKAFLSS